MSALDEITQPFPLVRDEGRNPFADELKEILRTLDAFDRRMDPMKTWRPEVYQERERMIWHAFDLARELDFGWGIAGSPDTPDGILLTIVLPLADDNYPVTWLLPAGRYGQQTKDLRSRRIAEYAKDLP